MITQSFGQTGQRTYCQMDRTDKYSEHSSIIWSIWPNGCVFVLELSGFGLKSRNIHLYIFFIIRFTKSGLLQGSTPVL